MTDYLSKARQGRILALSLHQSGAVMFFPEDTVEAEEMKTERPMMEPRNVVTQMTKPMFVRSVSVTAGAPITAPHPEEVANTPFLLTEAHAVEDEDQVLKDVLRHVA